MAEPLCDHEWRMFTADLDECAKCHKQQQGANGGVAQLRAEVARLTADYPGGDQDSQARSWSAVWKALWDAGMASHFSPGITGRERAIHFIRWLADEFSNEKRAHAAHHEHENIEVARLTAEVAALRQLLRPFESWPIYEGDTDDQPAMVRGTTGRISTGHIRRIQEELARIDAALAVAVCRS